ncbi:hypothetical protein FRC09_008134 [Ceratobasidium sp. 395]|nr:hypothetical protein FRC09_008134 [Ceratobasidium sp. 395]
MPQYPAYVVDSQEFLKSGHDICAAILEAKRISMMSGAGVSVAAGIPDYRGPEGIYQKKIEENGICIPGKNLFDLDTIQDVSTLALFNKTLTGYRKTARSAPLTDFHKLANQLHGLRKLGVCLTTNVDGLHTREYPWLKSTTLELHGTNNELYCPVCQCTARQPVSSYDYEMSTSGLVECTECASSETNSGRAKRQSIRSGYLVPRILLNQQAASDDHLKAITKHTKQAAQSQVFLVVASSLQTKDTFRLVKNIAAEVRRQGGVTIYVDTKQSSKMMSEIFDMQLQVDAQAFARCMQSTSPPNLSSEPRPADMQKTISALIDRLLSSNALLPVFAHNALLPDALPDVEEHDASTVDGVTIRQDKSLVLFMYPSPAQPDAQKLLHMLPKECPHLTSDQIRSVEIGPEDPKITAAQVAVYEDVWVILVTSSLHESGDQTAFTKPLVTKVVRPGDLFL